MDALTIIKEVFTKYGDIDENDLQKIQSHIKIEHLDKGEFFIRAGEVKDHLGIIISGCMRYFYLKNGEEITGEFWQEKEILGSFEGSFLNQSSTLFIEAIEPTEIITLSYSEIKNLANQVKSLDKIIIALLEKFLVESQLRIASYITETPEERYLRLRKEMPGIEDRVHQKYIASFVGVTPVTLSRIRGRLAKKR